MIGLVISEPLSFLSACFLSRVTPQLQSASSFPAFIPVLSHLGPHLGLAPLGKNLMGKIQRSNGQIFELQS